MASSVATVSDLVVTHLNAGTFTYSFGAKRRWVPEIALGELGNVQVTVVPKLYQRENATRVLSAKEIEIDIAVQKRLSQGVDPTDPAKLGEIDNLMELVESIADSFSPGGYAGFRYLRSVIAEPFYDAQLMRKDRIFQSVVTVSFKKPS